VFTFGAQFGFMVRSSMFGVPGSMFRVPGSGFRVGAHELGPNAERRTLNVEPNVNTNREARTEKGERQVHRIPPRSQQLGLLILLFVFIAYLLLRLRA
jgi:hypothetical protein